MNRHARADFLDEMDLPQRSARDLGYRLSAEFEPQEAVWVTLPHNAETWPGCLLQAREQFDHFIAALCTNVIVRTTQQRRIATNDSWIRDYGPIFVVRDESPIERKRREASRRPTTPRELGNGPGEQLSRLACHDFIFNAWGQKYGPWDADDMAPQHIARHLHVPVWVHDFVLEGGSIDVNGKGTLMTTSQCLLNLNRNPHMSKRMIEDELREALTVDHFIWLHGGISGDDTDGHVDDVARFITPDTVAAVRVPDGHPDRDVIEGNWRVLSEARDQDGGKLNLVELPVPAEPLRYTFPSGAEYDVGRDRLPASYANFLISNGCVFMPLFGQYTDDMAMRRMEEALPHFEVIGIRSEFLVVGMGALHCLTMPQPSVPVC